MREATFKDYFVRPSDMIVGQVAKSPSSFF